MSRLSSYFLPTLREDPADAEALSHRLMMRAGLIRQIGAGLWTFLPAGYRVVKRVEVDDRESAEGAEWLAKIEAENAGELTPERLAAMEQAASQLDEDESPTASRRFTRA